MMDTNDSNIDLDRDENLENLEERKVPMIFSPQEIGRQLKEVAVDYLQVESHMVMTRWFHGRHDADIFLWTDDHRNIIKQQISFCGQVVEWNVVDGLKTGVVIEEEIAEEEPGVDAVNASEVIRFDRSPQKRAIQLAVELIENTTEIELGQRQVLVTNLVSPKTISALTSDELNRFNMGSSIGTSKDLVGSRKESRSQPVFEESLSARLTRVIQRIRGFFPR